MSLEYELAAWEDLQERSATQIIKIRKLYVRGHIDRVAFVELLDVFGFEVMNLCEFIDVADASREKYEKKEEPYDQEEM